MHRVSLFCQWHLYDAKVGTWGEKLKGLCTTETVVAVHVTIKEKSSVRCAPNVISVTISHQDKAIPVGSYITITGLNGAL